MSKQVSIVSIFRENIIIELTVYHRKKVCCQDQVTSQVKPGPGGCTSRTAPKTNWEF